jgi:hypothetical protein
VARRFVCPINMLFNVTIVGLLLFEIAISIIGFVDTSATNK